MGGAHSSAPEDFKSSLETFLQSPPRTLHETKFARDQENRYAEAYKLFETDKGKCHRKLISIIRLQDQDFLEHQGRTMLPRERIWKTTLMARCYLLMATFYHERWLATQLGQLPIDAKWSKKDMKIEQEHQFEDLNEVEMLCGEMRDRIHMEREKMIFPIDDEQVPRMTDTWLAQTKRVLEHSGLYGQELKIT
ncbi:MAG: hypothetical protein Q9166_007981 [cf. Caloplaca sp. 2 TL-2023]